MKGRVAKSGTATAAIVAGVSSAVAFTIALASFGVLGGAAQLGPELQWHEPAVLAALTFVFAYLCVYIAAPWLGARRSFAVRFIQGAVSSVLVLAAVLAAYGALRQPADELLQALPALTGVTLWFGGWAIPLVSGALAVGLEAVGRSSPLRQHA